MSSVRPLEISASSTPSIALVAGGAGFLGSALCRFLLRKNLRVICIDNFQSGRRENIADLLNNKNFILLEHDLNSSLLKIEPPDYIFHLAGMEEYLNGDSLTIETLKVNAFGTQNLLELVRQSGAKFLFGSSCDIFSPLPLATKIAEVIDEQQKSFSHHEAKRFAESLIAQHQSYYHLNCRIVRLVDIYGPGMNFEAGTTMAKLIKAAKLGGAFIIEEDGLEDLYPVFIEDAIEGIIRAMFLSHTAGKIYNLLGPKNTVLKFAKTLNQLTEKKAEIEFRKNRFEIPKLLLPPDIKKTQEELSWQPHVSLEEGLKKTLTMVVTSEPLLSEEEPPEVVEEIPSEEVSLENERRSLSLVFPAKLILSLFLLLAALTFPFLSIAWDVFWGQKNLMVFVQKKSFSSSEAVIKAQEAKQHFSTAQEKLEDIGWLIPLLRQEKRQKEWLANLQTGQKIAAGIGELAQAGQTLEKLGTHILALAGGEVEEKEIRQAQVLLAAALEDWGEAEAQLQENPGVGAEAWTKQLTSYRQLVQKGKDWLEILPQLIALDGRKTYLLLLQNNMEIRPSGGFIGSFGLLTFEKGKLVDLKIEDVYTADGQLRGHVEPPEPIKKYLGKEHWFLRDANWDPNFPQTAQTAQWFLEKELGVKTDGVLAIDLNLVQNLLEVLGPLDLSDYQEEVGSQDLFEKTQKYTELDFFPGSTQKRDFLGALTKSLVEKMKIDKDKWLMLGSAANRALDERHLTLYLNDITAEQTILQNDWGGQIKPTPCEEISNCLGDYLMLVEANLGVNKVNYWMKKEVVDKVTFGKESPPFHKLTLNFQNQSSPQSWSGGVYKNYLRIYTPPGTILDNLKINGVSTTSAEIATTSADLTKNSGKTVWGVYFEVLPNEKKEIVASYHLPQKFSGQNQTYKFLLQKQAGSQTDPFAIDFSFPVSWAVKEAKFSSSVLSTSPGFSVNEVEGLTQPGLLQYNSVLATDKEFKISF